MPVESVIINGKKYVVNDVLQPWLSRKKQAEDDIKPYLNQVRINRMFAAGKQNLDMNDRDGRVVEVRRRGNVELITSNFLDQYINTVIGRLSSNDYKPNFHVAQEDNETLEEVSRMINMAFSWGWDNEWMGDKKTLDILRHLAIDGTVAVRTRYDRRYGEIVGDVPFKDGSPILDTEEAHKYVESQMKDGKTAEFYTLREGKVCWELLTIDNILPPPGVHDPADFPWEIIRRPVSVAEIKNRYGDRADDVVSEEIENTSSLTAGYTDGTPTKLEGMALVYTGYEKPNQQFKKGRTVVFTDTALLDVRDTLPLDEHPKGCRSGVHYFRWQVLPGRFVGKAFIENGIGPQKVYNKRLTQVNAIIDRGMPKVYMEEGSMAKPKTGEPMEIIELRPGAPLPKQENGIQVGSWMMDDIKLQVESAERALGIRGVSMGSAPSGVSAYSAMALLTENDALKLDPIGQDFGMVMDELCWDTMEQMRNWPKDKKMEVLGPNGRLAMFLFDSEDIPERYIVKRPHGGSLPRSQAAEIQKINDIWAASMGKLPLSWYVDSLNAGKPMNIPPSVGDSDSHKAELENIIILHTLEPPPVAPYDDDAKHVEIHRAAEMKAQARLDAGDMTAESEVAAFEAHIAEHERSATEGAPMTPAVPATPSPGDAMANPNPGGAGMQPGAGQDLLSSLGGEGSGQAANSSSPFPGLS